VLPGWDDPADPLLPGEPAASPGELDDAHGAVVVVVLDVVDADPDFGLVVDDDFAAVVVVEDDDDPQSADAVPSAWAPVPTPVPPFPPCPNAPWANAAWEPVSREPQADASNASAATDTATTTRW
jgi:hypothetical protein